MFLIAENRGFGKSGGRIVPRRPPSSLAPSRPYPSDRNYDIKRLRISNCFLPALVTVIVTVCIFDSFEVYNSTAAG